MKTFVLLACLAAYTEASCPNSCSNRGTCGADDVCTCFEGWKGGDCSYRICPFGASWTATSEKVYTDDLLNADAILATPGGYLAVDGNGDYDLGATYTEIFPKVPAFHQYTECSSRGNCNYATGVCNCFAGFEGRGCRRASCPNDCSGHGKCMLSSDIDNGVYSASNIHNSQFWDQDRTQQCVCDRGFQGVDCGSRVCPSGDNPMSVCNEGSSEDYQLVYISTGAGEYFTLTHRDQFGGEFTTRPIHGDSCTAGIPDDGTLESCTEVQYALMDLPNFAIPNVEVDELDLSAAAGLGATEHVFLVHFTDSANAGKQNTLSCDVIADSSINGAAPKFDQVDVCHVFHVGNPEWYFPSGVAKTFTLNQQEVTRTDVLGSDDTVVLSGPYTEYDEFIPCSGRGTCNGETGTCKCAGSATGEGCRMSTTYT